MRSTLVRLSAITLLVVGTSALNAQPKGERATITGEAVDLWCYLEGGDRGPAKKDCATACAKPATRSVSWTRRAISTWRRASRIISRLRVCC